VQAQFDGGALPDFLPETASVRSGDWRVAPLPADLLDRRVEITGPTDRKMVINALNSGASVYMPDFEDSNCPTWDNMVRGQVRLQPHLGQPGAGAGAAAARWLAGPPLAGGRPSAGSRLPGGRAGSWHFRAGRLACLPGLPAPRPAPLPKQLHNSTRSTRPTCSPATHAQANLHDAVRRTVSFSDPHTGKQYALGARVAVLVVRPRGWHLWERHVLVDGKPVPGGLFDFGLFLFHNAKELLARGSGPYFYLPKMEVRSGVGGEGGGGRRRTIGGAGFHIAAPCSLPAGELACAAPARAHAALRLQRTRAALLWDKRTAPC
jgi:hypothetical protein